MMETYNQLKERLDRVIAQKDMIASALSDILYVIRSGMYNGLFDSGFKPKEGLTKCKKGMEFDKVKYGCPHIGEGCVVHCPFSFDLYRVLEEKNSAERVLRQHDAAMIPFSFSEIPEYLPKKYFYSVTFEWFARRMVRFLLWNPLGIEEDREKVGAAFKRLVGFGCESVGFREGWRQLNELGERRKRELAKGRTDKEVLDGMMNEKNKFMELARLMTAAEKTVRRSFEISLEKAIRKNPRRAFKWIVLQSVMLIFEYDFNHDYPGADMGIYNDAFSFVGRLCLTAMRLKNDDRFGILDFVNSKDIEGSFKAERIQK